MLSALFMNLFFMLPIKISISNFKNLYLSPRGNLGIKSLLKLELLLPAANWFPLKEAANVHQMLGNSEQEENVPFAYFHTFPPSDGLCSVSSSPGQSRAVLLTRSHRRNL